MSRVGKADYNKLDRRQHTLFGHGRACAIGGSTSNRNETRPRQPGRTARHDTVFVDHRLREETRIGQVDGTGADGLQQGGVVLQRQAS